MSDDIEEMDKVFLRNSGMSMEDYDNTVNHVSAMCGVFIGPCELSMQGAIIAQLAAVYLAQMPVETRGHLRGKWVEMMDKLMELVLDDIDRGGASLN